MFIPNVRCKIARRLGFNTYGKPSYGAPYDAWCGIVRLEVDSDPTSVRTDSSASRGAAMEETATARILFPAHTQLAQGDMVIVSGITLTVQSVWPRHSVLGDLDHWQVDLTINQEG